MPPHIQDSPGRHEEPDGTPQAPVQSAVARNGTGVMDEELTTRQLKISDDLTHEHPCQSDAGGTKNGERAVGAEEGPERGSRAHTPSGTNARDKSEDTPKEEPSIHDSKAGEVQGSNESSLEEQFLLKMINCFSGDINTSIDLQSQLVALTPDVHAKKPSRLNDLGISYHTRFGLLEDLGDLDNAIDCFNKAALLISPGHPGEPSCVGNLGSCYKSRFERLGDPADIEKAIDCQTRAVSITPEGHADRILRLNNLGNSYQRRFENLGELSDVEKAIDFKTRAVSLMSEDHTERPAFINNLGSCYKARFEHLGELADINKAIDYQRQAVQLTYDGHEDQTGCLNGLGISYQRRFERLGELSDINEAIECQSKAVSITPDSYSDKGTWLNNLGISYQCRFARLGNLDDINKGIEYQNKSVELTPEDHAKMPAFLTNLGNSHGSRFEYLGDIEDIDKAIYYKSRTISLVRQGHGLEPTWLNNLGVAHWARFDRFHELEDIDKAIDCLDEAVSLTPDGHRAKSLVHNSLGVMHLRRFEFQKHHPADLEKAIVYMSEAVLLTPDDHADKPVWLNNLATAYQQRFYDHENLSDIDKAIDYLNKAMLLVPDDHKSKLILLDSLGTCYHGRFENKREPADIDKSIDYLRKAVSLTPDDHAARPRRLYNLGKSYRSQWEHVYGYDDRTPAVKCYEQAALSITGSPHVKLMAARSWAELSYRPSAPSLQMAHQRSLELASQVVWLGASIEQRYRLATEVADIAGGAAARSIGVEDFDSALEWLEEGRSIVWNQILQLRSPFDEVAAVNPSLAKNLEEVARKLEHASSRSSSISSSTGDSWNLELEAQQHRRLALEWDRLVAETRRIPGFHNFMRPRKAAELKQAAKNGPVAIINVHQNRSDALIIQPNTNDITHIYLMGFTPGMALQIHGQLVSLIHTGGNRARGFKSTSSRPKASLQLALDMLWYLVVRPVLESLGYTRKLPVDELPHITWCTTGALSFLPLHAAGCYGLRPLNAFEVVISSYTPTLGALLAPAVQSSDKYSGVLAVGQEHTKNFPDLTHTVAELAAIKEHAVTTSYLQLDGKNATVSAVLNAMEEYSWVHFACHASQNLDDPTQSAFHLHDGDLSISDITKRSFRNKGLAFLSACETATGDEKVPDEAVHLAAGMLMSGYQSVIATMWAIHDEDGPVIAQHIYAKLLKDGVMDCRAAARALHEAVQRLRENVGEESFVRWVPFVHLGS